MTLRALSTMAAAAGLFAALPAFGQEPARLEIEANPANRNNPAYIAILNAQANMKIAEGIANGRVNTIVVPSDFKGIVSVAK